MSTAGNEPGGPLDDGIERVRAAEQAALVKRFYTHVDITGTGNGTFAVHLDGRPVKSPGRVAVCVPSEALAERIAGEWRAQEKFIRPAS
ncbi:MAG: hypothetical protein GXP01_07915, partial [Alphaproteobacteria bacterium]|nr:hypothetical protein [Alphaproteobacteria bacterium]